MVMNYLPTDVWAQQQPQGAFAGDPWGFFQSGMRDAMGGGYGLPQYRNLPGYTFAPARTSWALSQFSPNPAGAFQDFYPDWMANQAQTPGGGFKTSGALPGITNMNFLPQALTLSKFAREGRTGWEDIGNPGVAAILERDSSGFLTDASKQAQIDIAMAAMGYSGRGYYGQARRRNLERMQEDYQSRAYGNQGHGGGFLDYLASLGYLGEQAQLTSTGWTDPTAKPTFGDSSGDSKRNTNGDGGEGDNSSGDQGLWGD